MTGPGVSPSAETERWHLSKLSYFFQPKIYRRTLLLYVLIVLLTLSAVLGLAYGYVCSSAQAAFLEEAGQAFRAAEGNRDSAAERIDFFLTRIYASPRLRGDFFRFFGAAPSAYIQGRLEAGSGTEDSYLASCDALIRDSGYAIRHMVYYTSEHLVDMEYNELGYSRQRIITLEEAEAICQTGFVYSKDTYRSASYMGRIDFVLDVGRLEAGAFYTQPGKGIYLALPGQTAVLGDCPLDEASVRRLLDGGEEGLIDLDGAPLYYSLHVSDQFPCTAVYTAGVSLYRDGPMSMFRLLACTLILVFALIAALLIRQFHQDEAYLQRILESMEAAELSGFAPLDTGGRQDELGAVAQRLNGLYRRLDALIQKEYKLTIIQQQTQMDLLSAQLNPHFLYNTLERIRMRAAADGCGQVAEAVAALGLLYRSIVKMEPEITVAKEMEITRQYLELMTFLYGDQFIYHFDVEPELESLPTPKIWMQPIVENFFKHNFQNDGQLKIVVVQGVRMDGGVEFRLFDNLGAISPDKLRSINEELSQGSPQSGGIGLGNVAHRLRLYYGDRVSVALMNNEPSGVCVQIRLKDEEVCHVSAADRG